MVRYIVGGQRELAEEMFVMVFFEQMMSGRMVIIIERWGL